MRLGRQTVAVILTEGEPVELESLLSSLLVTSCARSLRAVKLSPRHSHGHADGV